MDLISFPPGFLPDREMMDIIAKNLARDYPTVDHEWPAEGVITESLVRELLRAYELEIKLMTFLFLDPHMAARDLDYNQELWPYFEELLAKQAEVDDMLQTIGRIGDSPCLSEDFEPVVPRWLKPIAKVVDKLIRRLSQLDSVSQLTVEFCQELARSVGTTALAIYVVARSGLVLKRRLMSYVLVETCLRRLDALDREARRATKAIDLG